jgi:molybdenum cofactor guanylyltransferase
MIVGVILAGGASRRMGGGDKGLLPLGGRPLVAHVLDRLRPQVGGLAINANGDPARFAGFGLPVVADATPGLGPLGGLLAALDWAAGQGAAQVATVAADTPFLPADLVARLAQAAGAGGAVAATPGGFGHDPHPTAGLWPVGWRAPLRAALDAGLRRVRDFAAGQGAAVALFPDPDAFFNVNRPGDLAEAAARLAGPRPRLFDTVVVVDWSARGTPSPPRPSPDALWIGRHDQAPQYLRTRAEAVEALAALVAAERAAGRRLLLGFDFPFGYPHGFAAAATGRDEALAVWRMLAARLVDGPRNANDRFALAAALNRALPGTGPFWGRPRGLDLPGLPERAAGRTHPFAERRLVEALVPSAQSPWKLYTAGSVGGQLLTGLPALERLRHDPRLAGAAVWPFETGLAPPDAPVVLAEVYPSLLAAAVRAARAPGEVRDAAQVRVTAAALARLDARGGLAAAFRGGLDLAAADRALVAREEGWILGAGHETALRAAATPPD